MINDELKRALQEVKDECQKHGLCYCCIFHEPHGCALKGRPDKWIIGARSVDKWHKLYSWLNDTRLAIAPVFTAEVKEYNIRAAKVELIDEIMEYMEELDEEEDDEA